MRRNVLGAIVLFGLVSVFPSAAFADDVFAILFAQALPLPMRDSLFQSAVKAGDTPSFDTCIQSVYGAPSVTIDLSAFGITDSTIFYRGVSGPGNWKDNGVTYEFTYCYAWGPISVGAGITDGIKDVSLTATDPIGRTLTTTFPVMVDNVPPTFALSRVTFSTSTTSLRSGDVMYLSGTGDGTGSKLAAYDIRETLFTAEGSPVMGNAWIGYDQGPLTQALASSTDGSFSNVPFRLDERYPGELSRAATMTLTIRVYDEAGNFTTSSFTTPVPHEHAVSNVLFLPGIEASRLYRPDYTGGTDKLWEPDGNQDVIDLSMDATGASTRNDIYAREHDVLDEIPDGENIYKSFIGRMNTLKAEGAITDWEPIAYDWRLSLDDILTHGHDIDGRIYYAGDLAATSTPYVIQELRRLAATSKTGKVTIVAHSNGGLLAKRLTELLGPDEAARLIEKIIFVAVPQAGTPSAIAAVLHGYDQEVAFGYLVNKETARAFANDAPMAYQLMPSTSYFTQVDDPVISFDATVPNWAARYGLSIHSSDSLLGFLTDTFGRVPPLASDVNDPTQGNGLLYASATGLHDHLDTWTPPAGVPLVQIAGWGIPKTVAGVTYTKKGTGVAPNPAFTVDGDGTVVTPSALWTSTTAGATNYWVDLDLYNKRHPIITLGGFHPFSHKNILETNATLDFVTDQVTNTEKPLSDYTYLSTEAPASNDIRLRYALHSPLSLDLYDAQGRHTGVSTTTGAVEEQIPGSYYTELGDVKYLFSDASAATRLFMNGYATGTFTLNVDQYSGDTLTASTTFKDIPTTPETHVSISAQSDLSTLSPMTIDENGDGVTDVTLVPKPGGVVTLDTTPPELQIAFSTTTQALAFTATDESGPTALTSVTSRVPIKKHGEGNAKRDVEEMYDRKTAYRGPFETRTTVTARDRAGNTVALVYATEASSTRRSDIDVRAIAYNGATTTLSSTELSYQWQEKRGRYQTFESHVQTASSTLESRYLPKPNQTSILVRPDRLADDDDDAWRVDRRAKRQILPGMVIPYIATEKGSLTINY